MTEYDAFLDEAASRFRTLLAQQLQRQELMERSAPAMAL